MTMITNPSLRNEENKKTIEEVNKWGKGAFLDTDGIIFDLDGKGMATYLQELGYKVICHWDNGRNGYVLLECGLMVSTNGFVCVSQKEY